MQFLAVQSVKYGRVEELKKNFLKTIVAVQTEVTNQIKMGATGSDFYLPPATTKR